jgi:hypothetical protein
MGWDSELQGLENSLRNLNAQYDAFLYGSSHKPPVEIRRRIGQQFRQLSTTEPESSAQRFRFQALQVRYNALCERWDRLQTEKEAGHRPGIYSHFVRLGSSEPERPPARPNARAAASVEKVEEVVERKTARPGQDPERDLFRRYVEARRSRGEDVTDLRFDLFAEKLAAQRESLKAHFGGAEIVFDVAERDGKIRLVARPKEKKSKV